MLQVSTDAATPPLSGRYHSELSYHYRDLHELEFIRHNLPDAYECLPARMYDGRLPKLRASVTIMMKSLDVRGREVEQYGGAYHDPEGVSPHSENDLGCIIIVPRIARPLASYADSETNAIAGVHRHYQVVLSPATNTPLMHPDSNVISLSDKVNGILVRFMVTAAKRDPGLHLATTRLPLKWGAKIWIR